METKGTKQVKLIGIATEGICLKIYINRKIDILDFIEEVGKYFYKIDNPVFGQKYITAEAKEYVYYWLMELMNTGNYEEFVTKDTELTFNMLVDFEKIGTFKYAMEKYKKLLKKMQLEKVDDYKIAACSVAIDILQILEEIREE